MPNENNERSEYEFQVQDEQLEALLKLAYEKDQTLEEMIAEALDQYIEREENNGRGKSKIE
jgi:predicted transcriptional regulator